MNNKVSEEWLKKQQNKYLDCQAGLEFMGQQMTRQKEIVEKLESELTIKYNCHSYNELQFILTQANEISFKNKKQVSDNFNLYNDEIQKKYRFMKSINFIMMKEKILCRFQNRFLFNKKSMNTFLDLYTLSKAIYLFDLESYFGMELASHEGVNFTEDEKQALNFYNSLYYTYLEYYQRFVNTLPESELKQEFEAIPNELIKTENEKIEELIRVENEEVIERIFGKNSLKRKK